MKKLIFVICTMLFCAWGCSDDDKPVLKKEKTTISAEGGTVSVKGNYDFWLTTIAEIIEDKFTTIELSDCYEYEGDWYYITVDVENQTLFANVDENPTGVERKLAVSVGYMGFHGTYVITQKK